MSSSRIDSGMSDENRNKIDRKLLSGVKADAAINRGQQLVENPMAVALFLQVLYQHEIVKSEVLAILFNIDRYQSGGSDYYRKFIMALTACGYVARPKAKSFCLTESGKRFVDGNLSKKLTPGSIINLPAVDYRAKDDQFETTFVPTVAMIDLVTSFFVASTIVKKRIIYDMALYLTIIYKWNMLNNKLNMNTIIYLVYSDPNKTTDSHFRLRARCRRTIKILEKIGLVSIEHGMTRPSQAGIYFELTDRCKDALNSLVRCPTVSSVTLVPITQQVGLNNFHQIQDAKSVTFFPPPSVQRPQSGVDGQSSHMVYATTAPTLVSNASDRIVPSNR